MTGDRIPSGRMAEPEVLAAGGLLVRDDGRVAVVHRPRYDDWSLPKGKLDAGESFEDGARREVWEETGVRGRIREELQPVEYVDRKGRDKLVRWYRMDVDGEPDEFVPNDEVDELRWLTPGRGAGPRRLRPRPRAARDDRLIGGRARSTRGRRMPMRRTCNTVTNASTSRRPATASRAASPSPPTATAAGCRTSSTARSATSSR